MDTQETANRWDFLHLLLVAAACFALGSIGFLVAVLLEQSATAATPLPTDQLSIQQKNMVVQGLSASQENSASTSSAQHSISGTSTNSDSIPSAPAAPAPPSQADTNDQNAAAKLQVLDGLNSQ